MKKQLNYPEGPSSILPAKILRKFLHDPLNTFRNIAEKYGDLSHFKLGRQHVYLINNPDYIEKVLIYDHPNFKKGKRLQNAKKLIGEGLVTSEGKHHDAQKRIIQPFFLPKKISAYGSIMTKYTTNVSKQWVDGSIIDIHKEMIDLTFAIICKSMMNYDMNTKEAEKFTEAFSIMKHYSRRLQNPIGHVLDSIPILPKVAQSRKAEGTLEKIVYKLINDRKKLIKDKNISDVSSLKSDNADLLTKLLLIQKTSESFTKDIKQDNSNITKNSQIDNSNSELPDKQIRDHLITMLLAGHETTANALTWTFYLIAQNPDVEKKLTKEIDALIQDKRRENTSENKDNTQSDRNITVKDIPKLKYVEKVLRESMRLYPPVWSIGRMVKEDYQLGEYTIPKDSSVFMSQYVMHRDNRFYKDPELFNPDRWTDDFKRHLPRFAYFPFGGGLRGCIGEPFAWQEGILILANMMKSWTMSLAPNQRIKLEPGITLNPKKGIKMELKSRMK
ncbi:MAG: cytochrome P450 [Nitrososphaeraceae archaeon]